VVGCVTSDTGAWRVFQGFDTSKMTIAAWVTTPSRIAEGVILDKTNLISLSYTTCFLCPYTVRISHSLSPLSLVRANTNTTTPACINS
jgi:hypothetical protein